MTVGAMSAPGTSLWKEGTSPHDRASAAPFWAPGICLQTMDIPHLARKNDRHLIRSWSCPVHLAPARVHNSYHSGIIAEAGYSETFPFAAPDGSTQHYRQQLLHSNVDICPTLRKLQLEPLPSRGKGPRTLRRKMWVPPGLCPGTEMSLGKTHSKWARSCPTTVNLSESQRLDVHGNAALWYPLRVRSCVWGMICRA